MIAWRSGEVIGVACTYCAPEVPVISRRLLGIGCLELFRTAKGRYLLSIKKGSQRKILLAAR